jgi:hypothetical protein
MRTCKARKSFAPLFVTVIFMTVTIGCNSDQSQPSPSYAKLPPGEGERRLKDTLYRRAHGIPMSAPLSADQKAPDHPDFKMPATTK